MKNPVQLIPIFDNNYVFLITDSGGKRAILVDPGEATKAIAELEKQELNLAGILITHHHADHIDGLAELKEKYNAPVYAPLANRDQIPADHYVTENDKINLAGYDISIMALPGHTLGIQAYWFAEQKWLFAGDVIFGLGCGRLFEGSFEQGFASLQKIKSLPDDTQIFCTHEYTMTNLKFCKSLGLENPDLKNYESHLKIPSVPLALAIEKITSPFLLADSVAEFKKIRELRNSFKA